MQKSKKSYDSFDSNYHTGDPVNLVVEEKSDKILGKCPVASVKTRCCNLLTLDAAKNCGFDCSYCSIQSFYNQNKIAFDKLFRELEII